jgi:hypothetical protein
MTDFDKFLLWEAKSRDTIDFKKVYVDIAGDLIAGLLLSQIIYWYLPDEHGKTKLRVQKDGHLWIAKARDNWWCEIRITAKQFDRASNILIDQRIITKDHFRFGGLRMVHIRLEYNRFMELWQAQLELPAITQRSNPQLPKGEDRVLPKVKPAITQRGRPLTKTTTETTEKQMPQSGTDDFSDFFGNQSPPDNLPKNGKPKPSEADKAHLRTFGVLPDQVDPDIYAIRQEINTAGWHIHSPDVETAIIYFVQAVRSHHSGFVLPNDTPTRKDWYKAVSDHLKNYSLEKLSLFYKKATIKMSDAQLSFWRPGSLTKWALPEVANETAQPTQEIDLGKGFYI